MITVKHLSKRFKTNAVLSNMSFEIGPGEAAALWGPNGAGKTTLLRCLLGTLRCDGDVRILDADVKKDGSRARSYVGYVPQDIRLHLDQTVWETVTFYAALKCVPKERCEALLADWGLFAEKKKLAQNLSGGMKQKLALVIALLSDPPILFLDEPTSHLDAAARGEFEAVLARLKAVGKTLVFCSHRQAEVEKIADRVIALGPGGAS